MHVFCYSDNGGFLLGKCMCRNTLQKIFCNISMHTCSKQQKNKEKAWEMHSFCNLNVLG